MSSIGKIPRSEINQQNPLLSNFRTTIETAFYGNNVKKINSLTTAYNLAQACPGTITTDLDVLHTHELGLPTNAKVLVSNDGTVVGRTAAARRIIGQQGVDPYHYSEILREAIFQSREKNFYRGDVLVGLDQEFSVTAHLMLPEEYAANLYSYLLNFQMHTSENKKFYQDSQVIPEGDIFLFADPDWSDPEFPHGLVIIDAEHNCAAVLGLRYFGELKKATLTLAWAMAHRNQFIACHGGMKQYRFGKRNYTMAAFGLSGSGKSTITLAQHDHKYEIDVLHDDAFVISKKDGATTALEPAYFDKMQDYPMDSTEVGYIVTAQNIGVTLDEHNQKVMVTEDIRNGNGRSVKSRFATKNRVDHIAEKIDGVFWIMKDDSLPPIIKVENPALGAAFGVTLATKRSTAEYMVGKRAADELVIEPFANPFRSYPLAEDYRDFRDLFAKHQTDCYILNTGFFNQQKVTPQETLGSLEQIVEEQAEFIPFGPVKELSYLPLAGHEVDFNDQHYLWTLIKRMKIRLDFIQSREVVNGGYDQLPKEAELLLQEVLVQLEAFSEALK